MEDKIELLREFRRGDKVLVKPYGIKGIVILAEKGDRFHVKVWEADSFIELPHRTFAGHELEGL